MINIVTKEMDGKFYALAYDGDTCLFKTALFDTESVCRGGRFNKNNKGLNVKTTIIFTVIIYLLIAVQQDATAGIAGFFSWFQGECDKEDENKVRFCSDRETGRIYYVYEGIAFNSYPDLKKD